MCVCVCVPQARESASLRETLRCERDAHAAGLGVLQRAVLKLEKQMETQEARPPPAVTEAELEGRRRAEEKAAQEILRLSQVGPRGSG